MQVTISEWSPYGVFRTLLHGALALKVVAVVPFLHETLDLAVYREFCKILYGRTMHVLDEMSYLPCTTSCPRRQRTNRHLHTCTSNANSIYLHLP